VWINEAETLLEHRNKDTWQLPLESGDGQYIGNIVAQVVEPEECMVRYFLVYQAEKSRHFLLPSDTVTDISDKVYCELDSQQITQIPAYESRIDRDDEHHIYQSVHLSPYWT